MEENIKQLLTSMNKIQVHGRGHPPSQIVQNLNVSKITFR